MNATWGYEDRTAAIRIKGGKAGSTHVENRIPCAASNPYLVAAGMLAAGIDGITRQIDPPAPTEGIAYADENAPKLPTSLEESLAALEADATLREYLGEEFIQLFTAVKRFEIEKAKAAIPEYESAEFPDIVTDWERENLFEYL
jgi:glutamine synthetase